MCVGTFRQVLLLATCGCFGGGWGEALFGSGMEGLSFTLEFRMRFFPLGLVLEMQLGANFNAFA